MSTETIRPLSLLNVNFSELYARHLGRHSQFGINVAHLGALYGMWFGIYAAIEQAVLPASPLAARVIVVVMALTYLAAIGINAPARVILATAAFLSVFVASVLALPRLPLWSIPAFLVLVPVFYKLQAWSHKVWNRAASMVEFNKQFPPGPALALILLVNEVPICLNYLVFHREDWRS